MKQNSIQHYTVCREKNSDFEKNFLRALPGFYDFSGWDLTSAFYRIGKKSGSIKLKIKKEYSKALGLLGEYLQIEDHLFNMIENILCQVYGFLKKPDVSGVRYEKWCREKFPETSKIPPTKDELHQRIKYRNCQRFALKNFLKAKQEIPDAGQQR